MAKIYEIGKAGANTLSGRKLKQIIDEIFQFFPICEEKHWFMRLLHRCRSWRQT
jgi:hypothetical protein